MKRLKKIISIVLSLMVIFSGLTLSVSHVNALDASGNCGANGSNVTWQFDFGTKTLTISGTGAMEDCENESSPFFDSGIQNLVIDNGITSIGEHAFEDNLLASVTIPNSVITIGKSAFAINRLTSVIIPNSVTTIGDYAFAYNELTSVTIPNSVTSIGDGTFDDNELTSATIPDNVTTIGDNAFSDNQLTSVTIPNSVTTIGKSAFSSNQLTSVTIPNSVTTIEYGAFAQNLLASVTIPDSVTTIGEYVFYDNDLASVTIPNSVTTIGEGAFANNQLTDVTIPNSVTSIGIGAFAFNNTLTKAVILNKNAIIEDVHVAVFQDSSSDFKLYGYANSTASAYAINARHPVEFVELKEITDTMIGDIATQYFKGNAITPTVKVNDGTKDLVLDKDYTVSYKDNDKAGIATVIITGIGDYEYATATKTFEIKKQQYKITVTNDDHSTVTPSSEAMVDYDGSKDYVIKANDGYTLSSVLVNGEEKISTLNNDILTISHPTKDTTIEVMSKADEYQFIDGKDRTITVGDSKDLTFTINAPLDLLDKVYVNDNELDVKNYTTTSGSTIITLNKDYLATLKAGTYTLKVTYKNGTDVTTTFTVKEKEVIVTPTDPTTPVNPTTPTNPVDTNTNVNTRDNTQVTLWLSSLGFSTFIGLILNKKRKMK